MRWMATWSKLTRASDKILYRGSLHNWKENIPKVAKKEIPHIIFYFFENSSTKRKICHPKLKNADVAKIIGCLTSAWPLICTETKTLITVAKSSRCAWTSCVSMCMQWREYALRSSTLAMTDSCCNILSSRATTEST